MGRALIYPLEEKYQDYLSDESRMVGRASSISFPETEEEIVEIITAMRRNPIPITIQGGKTGIAGGAVPLHGHILNLSKMNRVKQLILTDQGETLLKVEPGITLLELAKEIKKLESDEELFWPPDPTETAATVGGIASCNAKGISAHHYGETREHIVGAKVALSNGVTQELKRGETFVPFLRGQEDLLDLFLGGEGLFGVITELTLKLQPKPKEVWAFMFCFEKKEELFAFVKNLINKDLQVEGTALAAAEYLDRTTLDLIEERKRSITALQKIPDLDSAITAVIYLEIHSSREEAIEEVAENLIEPAIRSNSDPDRAWAVSGDAEVQKLRAFRHAAAECANQFTDRMRPVDPRLTKLETYLKLENEDFSSVITKYEADIKAVDLKVSIFGHIGENQLHVNLLPENYHQYEKGRRLFEKWAKEIAGQRGRIDRQHGVGKLKKSIFLKMAPKDYILELQRLKHLYDSIKMWNPDNLI